jgi:[acyl-carrier-protein] S-malonyltransferase
MSAAKTAWLFPGHGSQYPGMGREVLESSVAAREIFDAVEALAGFPVREAMLRGPAERLSRPLLLEPALTALALSHAALLEERGLAPDYVGGYSAGEVPAIHVAGVVGRHDALRLAVLRGRILERAASGPRVRMAALHGIPALLVEEIVFKLQHRGLLAVAGWNAPDHLTLVGAEEVVMEAERRARGRGAMTAVVTVAGAWHSPAVAGAAAEAWAESLEIEFRAPILPLFLGSTGQVERDPARIRAGIAEQICQPVRWRETVEGLLRCGCTRFLELGPGGVLGGFLRRNEAARACEVRSVERRGGRVSTLLSDRRAVLAADTNRPG